MGSLIGRRLTALGLSLIAVAMAAAGRVALSGDLGVAGRRDIVAASPGASAAEQLRRARDAEAKGDFAEAMSRYRAAVTLAPQLVDRRSVDYLGPGFEANLRRWIAELKAGKGRRSSATFDDASFLFRRMYGGCG